MAMTRNNWRTLEEVNWWINDSLTPVSDMVHWGVVEHWDLPTDGKGDCEDFALLKRKILLNYGWPIEALLITVVRDLKGDGHAVLTVSTTMGDFVLDNRRSSILYWFQTGYTFVKRQSQSDLLVWERLDGNSKPAAVAAAEAK